MVAIRWAGLISLSVALLPTAAWAQGAAKKAPPTPATVAQVAKLQVALQKLSLRVTELEQEHAADMEDDDVTQANLLKMQDVIARLAKSMGETQKTLDATQQALAATQKTLASVKAAQAVQKAVGDAPETGSRSTQMRVAAAASRSSTAVHAWPSSMGRRSSPTPSYRTERRSRCSRRIRRMAERWTSVAPPERRSRT
jgi:hypothetical protein